MDTKLKKTRRLSVLVIALCALIPALILLCCYPMMGRALEQKIAKENKVQEPEEFWLQDNFVNYAMESSYYLYGKMLQEYTGKEVVFDVLEECGWINDYYFLEENADYYVEYSTEEDVLSRSNGESKDLLKELLQKEENRTFTSDLLENQGVMGYLYLDFDTYGEISDIKWYGEYGFYDYGLYSQAKRSVEQYQDNASYWIMDDSLGEDQILEVEPKNFRGIFAVYKDSSFICSSDDYYDSDSVDYEYHYLDMGAEWLIIILAVFVGIAALVIPGIKKLETGQEKIFRMPFEVICGVAMLAISCACMMFMAMSHTNMHQINAIVEGYGNLEFLGNEISTQLFYGLLLAANFIGWALSFFLEYLVFVSIRQFFANPKQYLRERLLIVRIWRWIVKQSKRLYVYVTDIDITEKLHNSILKIVVINFIMLTMFCCLWFFGIAGLILYSIGVYVLLRKFGEKLQKQYNSVLKATEQMANGDLKIKLDEDLGIFKPIGEELEKVQQGFSKAVAEEAKSQNMKTELITNVSHDLKTPLTAIITYVDLLKQEGITEEERKSYIRTIEQKSDRLKCLIEDLFEVSKANSGNVTMNLMDVDVVNLLKQIRLEMETQILESNLVFRWNLPDEKIIFSLDSQKTYRVFENLLNNILKYAMPYSRVYVDVVNQADQILIMFRNTSAVELDFDPQRLTERFVRGDASRNSEGSGLGLAIAKSFVELQNGIFQIDVDGDLFKVQIIWKKN